MVYCTCILFFFRGPVYSVSIHPTGKMAISVGKDKTLRIWDLMTGKCAYVTNTKYGRYRYTRKYIVAP